MIEYKLYSEVKGEYEIVDGFFEGWVNPPSKAVHKKIMENSYKTVVAVDTEKRHIVGFINIISDGVMAAYIPMLEVISSYRKRGVGKELVKRAMEETKHLYMIDLSCDDNMVAFYEKFGMSRASAMIIRNYDRQCGE